LGGKPHCPWKFGRVLEPRRAPGHEKLRDLAIIEVFLNCNVGSEPKRLKHEQYLVAFDEFANLFDCLGRRRRVIVRDQVYLPSIDAAAVVDHSEIGRLNLADHR